MQPLGQTRSTSLDSDGFRLAMMIRAALITAEVAKDFKGATDHPHGGFPHILNDSGCVQAANLPWDAPSSRPICPGFSLVGSDSAQLATVCIPGQS